MPEGTAKATCSSFDLGGQEVALEVIDDLRRNARPVDRIDRTDLVLGLEDGIVGNGLDDVLRVVEQAGNGDVEDVGILQRIHLGALEGAHLAIRREHEDLDIMFAAHGVFGRRTGVAGGGAEDVDRLVALVEHVLEQVAEQLHGHVLEGQRRAVRQFLRVEAVFEPGQRRDLRGIATIARVAINLGGVCLGNQRLEISDRNVGNELGEDLVGEVGIRQLTPGIEFGAADLRIAFRQVKAAIGRQTAEEDVAESLGRGVTAGRDIAHGENLKAKSGDFTASTATHAWLAAVRQ